MKRVCRRCGTEVVKETEPTIDYPYYCPECDENMYTFETVEVLDVDFVMKQMKEFKSFLEEEIEKLCNNWEYSEMLYETFFKVEWLGKTVYIPFGACVSNGILEILDEEIC